KQVGNTLWFGTLGHGIYIYNPEEKWFKNLTENDGLVNNNVLSITPGFNGIMSGNRNMYVATLGGASKIEMSGNKFWFKNLSRANGLPADYIYYVYEGDNDAIWFCTDGKGLIKLQDGKYTVFNEKNGLKAKTITYISPANKKGRYYVVSADEGLFMFDGKRFKKLNFGNDITDNSIRSVIIDNKEQTLLVHANGVDIVNPGTNDVKTYRHELGLEGIDPELNAWSREENGNYKGDFIIALGNKILHYFNTNPGIVSKPQTRIKNISLFLDNIPDGKTRFNYNENYISFDYIGLWFHNPEEVTYQVKLEGHDRNWVNTRDDFITYPNLQPGEYTFKVRSSATDNFSNVSEASYQFQISAPFWKRAWFYIPVILLIIAGIYFYIRRREKILKKEADIARQNIEFQYETLRSQVNPHFLFNSFNTLAGVIETDQQMAVEYVEHLSDFFRNLLVYKDKDVITLKDELALLQHYFFIQKKRFGQNLHLDIQTEDKYKTWLLPPLCLQLLIENAIKHNIISREKPLNITIQTTADAKLVVRNNFQLKSFAEKSTGIGLANIQSRYSLLTKAPVNIINDGQYFTVELPLIPPK
ncbi:MAG: histidine kinase, partial [Bacteroidia bacterium]